LTFYVNGIEDGSISYSGTVVNLQQTKVLGTSEPIGFPGDFFHGLIDEPSIYDRALSALEIQKLFANGNSAVLRGVTVNLPQGTASGFTGGIAHIQNVMGSALNDILIGNAGNVLSGGAGDDLLIAGASASALDGGMGRDILVGGTTNYDTDPNMLDAILAEWTTNHTTSLLNVNTVQSNHAANQLTGGNDADLLFARLASELLDFDPQTDTWSLLA
jgi:hypothetical protein